MNNRQREAIVVSLFPIYDSQKACGNVYMQLCVPIVVSRAVRMVMMMFTILRRVSFFIEFKVYSLKFKDSLRV